MKGDTIVTSLRLMQYAGGWAIDFVVVSCAGCLFYSSAPCPLFLSSPLISSPVLCTRPVFLSSALLCSSLLFPALLCSPLLSSFLLCSPLSPFFSSALLCSPLLLSSLLFSPLLCPVIFFRSRTYDLLGRYTATWTTTSTTSRMPTCTDAWSSTASFRGLASCR